MKRLVVAAVFLAWTAITAHAGGVSIRLNHLMAEPGYGGYRYVPVYEEAYVVAPHVLVTVEAGEGHFPDDGTLADNTPVWFYMVDWAKGVKAFLVEKDMGRFVTDAIPQQVAEFCYEVARELTRDGGWANRIEEYREGKKKYEEMWRRWNEDK